MRTIAFLAMVLMGTVAFAQDGFFSATTDAPASAEVLARLEALEKQVAQLKQSERCQCDAGGTACPCENCNCGKPAAPSAVKKNGWSIVMETIDNCAACELVEKNDRPRYERDGWSWRTEKVARPLQGAIYPRLIVCNGTSCFVIDRMRRTDELDGWVRTAIATLTGSLPAFGF